MQSNRTMETPMTTKIPTAQGMADTALWYRAHGLL